MKKLNKNSFIPGCICTKEPIEISDKRKAEICEELIQYLKEYIGNDATLIHTLQSLGIKDEEIQLLLPNITLEDFIEANNIINKIIY